MQIDKKRVKTGGRKKGSCNVLTREIRHKLKDVINGEIETLSESLNKLDLKDRIEYLIKLLPYCLPKIENVHMSENEPFDVSELNW